MSNIKPTKTFQQDLNSGSELSVGSLYPVWEAGKAYQPNTILRHGVDALGEPQLYIVIMFHNSQSDWLPSNLPALYKKIAFTAEGIAVWVQPLGGTDAYAMNAIVMHKGQKWKSVYANNVWEPSVFGWVVEP